jgi:hypothetical protein
MTDQPDGPVSPEFDPGSMATSSFATTKAIWYKRPWFLVVVVVAAVVVVSVISDLPHPITRAQDTGDQNAALKQINGDLSTCTFSLKEAFNLYRLDVENRLTPANVAALPALLTGDYSFCSGTTSPLLDMTENLQIVDTAAGKQMEGLRNAVFTWINYDARNAIGDIEYLVAHPGDAKRLADLTKEQNLMVQDRQLALNYLGRAENLLGSSLRNLNLPTMARLPGT